MLKAIYDVDDLGLDAISTGNVIGFLMEAYEKGMIDRIASREGYCKQRSVPP